MDDDAQNKAVEIAHSVYDQYDPANQVYQSPNLWDNPSAYLGKKGEQISNLSDSIIHTVKQIPDHPLSQAFMADPVATSKLIGQYVSSKAQQGMNWVKDNPSEAAGNALELAATSTLKRTPNLLWGPSGILNPTEANAGEQNLHPGESYIVPNYKSGGTVLERAIALSRPENDRMARKDGGKTYSKEESEFQYKGLTIGIQTSKGEKRKHHGDVKFPADYGYIGDTEDNDDMNVDVYMGPNKDSDKAVVINQYRKSGKFDEHKVMLGFKSQAAAVKAYKDSWPKKKAEVRYGDSVAMSVEDLKKWLEYGNTKKPIKKSVLEQAIMLSKKKA
jgi:hypothetical protein